jgi:transcriptional regulator with XRE-family HTH domain
MQNIGEKIRFYRTQKGYSQDYMATLLEIAQSTYAKYESDATEITVKRLMEIAKLLETDINAFIKEDAKNIIQNNHDHSSQNYVGNITIENNAVIEVLKDENSHLKEEIIFLRKLIEKS